MVITLTGPNSFVLKRELDVLVRAFLAEHGDMGLERVDGDEAEADRISEALTSLPFLVSRKLVVLRSGSANKKFAENVEKMLSESGIPETTNVVIVEPKLDKRSSYYKYLKKATDYREFAELDANGLALWAVAEAGAAGGSLNLANARFLIERTGTNQEALSHELAKLLLYQSDITRTTIELLAESSPQSTIFELLEAAFAGNAKRAMALYQEQRTLKVEPQQIIAMLAWQLHILALIKTAGNRTPDTIASDAKISPYVAKKTANVARSISLPRLKDLITNLLTIDTRLKRESLDADEALQNYLLQLAA